jgi:membrane-bound lytic murein transglycosylase D
MSLRRFYCAASFSLIFLMALHAEKLLPEGGSNEQETAGTESPDSLQTLPESSDSGGTEVPPPASCESLLIPGSDDPLVDKYRKYYLTPGGIKWLTSVLDNGEQYRLYIRRQLKERNMPALLEYLPVVESSYKPDARSKAGAVGLWQFMPNSTKPFLTRNDFVDERLDPWKSTDAALTKLQENYNMFQDWPIAIAAYNCGAGAMARILKKYPEKDFWFLAEHKLLRDQSVQYVPKLIAIADLAQNSTYYNIALPAVGENKEPVNPRAGFFDYVQVDGAVSLRRLANELRIDEGIFLSLNSALIRGITPPSGSYNIRVPEGMEQSARDALTSITRYRFQTRYKVEEGDSLWGIAKRYSITVNSLCGANNISEKAVLKIGKILYIPAE